MDHLIEPLETLRGRAMAWLADERARVLAVSADPELHEGARAVLASLEWAPDNRRAFFELRGGGWTERTDELRAIYDAQRAAFAKQALTLPELPARATPPGGAGAGAGGGGASAGGAGAGGAGAGGAGAGDAIGAFARELLAVTRAFVSDEIGTRGIMVAMEAAPPAEARALVGVPGLEQARWIWLEVADATDTAARADAADAAASAPPAHAPVDRDPAVWTVACRIDRAAQRRESDELLASAIAAVASGAGGPPGGARPRMAPPRHPGDPRPPATAAAGTAALGAAAPAPVATPPPHLHPMLLGIQALRASDLELAVQRFREARDAAAGAGDAAEAVEVEILLAATGARLALERQLPFHPVPPLFEAAAARAEAAGLLAAAAKARFLLGTSATAAGDVEGAARALLAAAELAKLGGAGILRVHALRSAAELASRAGLRARAAELWREALDGIRQMDPNEARAAGLTEVADEIERALRPPGAPPAPPHGARRPPAEDVAP